MKYANKTKLIAGFLALLVFIGLGNLLAMNVQAEDQKSSSEIRNQIEQMESESAEIGKQIQELESQIQENLTEMEAIVAQKNIIDQEIYLLHQQIANTNEIISAYNVLIADKQEELTAAEKRLAELNEKNKERIRAMEEDGALSYWAVLFKANSFADLLDRLNMIEEIAASDQRRLEEMREAAAEVAAAQEELVTEKANLELVQEELAAQEASLQAKAEEADELLAQLIATGEEYEAYLEERELAQAQKQEQIDRAEAEYESVRASEIAESIRQESIAESIRQEQEATETTAAPYVPEPTKPVTSASGWSYPLESWAAVTSAYGRRWHPVHHEWRFHHGVDLGAAKGTAILASRSGTVVKTSYEWNGAGYYVTIDHGDGYTSTYMHMTHYIVKAGQYVEAGEVIGYVGSTGASTGPHLHFGIYYNGKSVNPANYVDFS